MRSLGVREVIHVPADQGICPACRSDLFATIHMYFEDTGEPIENAIHVGCVDCEAEIGDPLLKKVRQWVLSSHRISVLKSEI